VFNTDFFFNICNDNFYERRFSKVNLMKEYKHATDWYKNFIYEERGRKLSIFRCRSNYFLLILILLLFISGTLNSQTTRTWVPTTGGVWTTAANWSPNGVPVAGDNIIINSDQSAPITGHPAISLANITINGNCTLSSNRIGGTRLITVTSSFTVNTGKTIYLGSTTANYRTSLTVANTATGTINGTVYIYTPVASANTFTLSGNLTMGSSGIISGVNSSTFTLSSGATLQIANTAGIAVSGAAGAIQTNIRTFSTGANYIYNGTLSQVTGTGLTQNTPRNLTINNSAGVSLSATTTISGLLTMTSGTLNMANNNLTTGGLTGSANITNSSGTASAVTITTGSANTSPAVYSGIISNGTATSVALTKNGTGTLSLSGANTYTGLTNVSAGALNIQNSTATGTTAGGVTVSSGAALQLQGGISVGSEALTISGTGITTTGALRNISGNNSWGGSITLGLATTFSSSAGNLVIDVTSGNAISGTFNLTFTGAGNISVADPIAISTGTLTKSGAGILTLSGTNTYTGTTTISAGVLNIQNSSALGGVAGGTVISNGAALQLQGGISVGAEALSVRGSGITATGAIRNITGNNTWGGPVTQAAASTISSDAGTLIFDVSSGNAISGTFNLTLTGAGNISIADPVAISTGTVTKTGSGTLLLSAANTYTGTTTVSGGVMQYGIANALSTGNVVLSSGTISTGATSGYTDAVGTLSLTNTSTIALGTGNHSISFANSSAAAWTASRYLFITGWTGTRGDASTGTAGKVFFGNSSAGLTATQLSKIFFSIGGNNYTAQILSTGEVKPTNTVLFLLTGTVNTQLCRGSAGNNVPFTYGTTAYFTGTTFTAQLSDAAGDFSSPTNLQSVATNGTGSQSISVTIPAGTAPGTGYRIRVISSSPSFTGSANSSDITIGASLTSVSVSPSGTQTICFTDAGSGLTVTETEGGSISRQWGKRSVSGGSVTPITGETQNTYLPSGIDLGAGKWYIVCTSTPTCGVVTVSNEVEITVLASGTWLGADNDWNNPSNWCGGIPDPAVDVIITSTPSTQPVISGLPAAECNSLTVNPGASLTINSGQALTVDGDLSNSGIININSTLTSSGSLIVQGSSTGNVTYTRQMRPESNFGNRHFFSSPVGNLAVADFLSANSNLSQIWEWEETDGSWPVITTSNFVSGQGYNLKQTSGSTGAYSFTGQIVNSASVIASSPYATGYIDRSSSFAYGNGNPDPTIWSGTRNWTNYGGGGWNLLGNPFTSAMDATAFISANSASFDPFYQALYIWDGENYRYYFAAAAVPGYPQSGSFGTTVQAGQGFFVLALYDGIVFNFTSSMRVHSSATTFAKSSGSYDSEKKAEVPWPGLKLKVKHGNIENITSVVYNAIMNAGLDPGYDVGLCSSGSDVEIFTSLAAGDNGVNMTRQALPTADCDKYIVPVGINTENGGEVTLSADIIPLDGYTFYLEDRLAGTFTDLSEASYSVIVKPATYGTGQFYIHASSSILTGINPEKQIPDPDNMKIWVSDETLIIKGNVGSRAFCEVYDLNGRKILTKTLAEGEMNSIAMPSGSKGFFIVRVIDGLNVKTLKAVIS
jgi:autotransporter-associated beta strand protein